MRGARRPARSNLCVADRTFKETTLDDFLTADRYPSPFRSQPFTAGEVRKFIASHATWFLDTPSNVGGPKADDVAAAHGRLDRLHALLEILRSHARDAVQAAYDQEEWSLVESPESIPDLEIEQLVIGLRSDKARAVAAAELVRRALAHPDPANPSCSRPRVPPLRATGGVSRYWRRRSTTPCGNRWAA